MAIKLETGSLHVSHMDGTLYEVGHGHVSRYYDVKAALKVLDHIKYAKPSKGKDPINGFKIKDPHSNCYDVTWGNGRYHFLSVDEDNTVTLDVPAFIADNLRLDGIGFNTVCVSVNLRTVKYDTLISALRKKLTEDLKTKRTIAVKAVNEFARKLQAKANKDKYENMFLSFWNNGDYDINHIARP